MIGKQPHNSHHGIVKRLGLGLTLLLARTMRRMDPKYGSIELIAGEGSIKDFPNRRDFAYTFFPDSGQPYELVVSPRLKNQSPSRVIAIIRHEVAHAVLHESGEENHTERETDRMAEEIWGQKIYYDDEDVQTLEVGTRPRPDHLPD